MISRGILSLTTSAKTLFHMKPHSQGQCERIFWESALPLTQAWKQRMHHRYNMTSNYLYLYLCLYLYQGRWWYKSESKAWRRWNEMAQLMHWDKGKGKKKKKSAFFLLFSVLFRPSKARKIPTLWGGYFTLLSHCLKCHSHLEIPSQTCLKIMFNLAT